jgi:hypothetical protein
MSTVDRSLVGVIIHEPVDNVHCVQLYTYTGTGIWEKEIAPYIKMTGACDALVSNPLDGLIKFSGHYNPQGALGDVMATQECISRLGGIEGVAALQSAIKHWDGTQFQWTVWQCSPGGIRNVPGVRFLQSRKPVKLGDDQADCHYAATIDPSGCAAGHKTATTVHVPICRHLRAEITITPCEQCSFAEYLLNAADDAANNNDKVKGNEHGKPTSAKNNG